MAFAMLRLVNVSVIQAMQVNPVNPVLLDITERVHLAFQMQSVLQILAMVTALVKKVKDQFTVFARKVMVAQQLSFARLAILVTLDIPIALPTMTPKTQDAIFLFFQSH